jgi:uncharacterized protein YbjQ (UPF0145 family)
MTSADILTVSSIDGFRIQSYLGLVSGVGKTYDEMIQDIIASATKLGADKVIGFQVFFSGQFYGQGTAVIISKR